MYTPFEKLSQASKIWIYQSNRSLNEEDKSFINQAMKNFTENWQSHGSPVTGSFEIVKDHFIVIAADPESGNPSGCSIDSSVGVIREIEQKLGITLLDKSKVAFEEGEEIRTADFRELKNLVEKGQITPTTPIYNNNVTQMTEFANQWRVPAGDSWVKRYFN